MRPLPVYHNLRICLKYVHVVSTGLWLGSGGSILFLLFLNWQTRNGKELYAFNLATSCIDNYLLIPSASICIVSGTIICVAEDLMMFTCSWIVTKCACSILALSIGTFIAPEINQLLDIVTSGRASTHLNLEYSDILTTSLFLAIFQTLIILYVVFTSIKRPCSNFKNCKQCRESRQVGTDQSTLPR